MLAQGADTTFQCPLVYKWPILLNMPLNWMQDMRISFSVYWVIGKLPTSMATLISTTKQSFINNLTSQAILVISPLLQFPNFNSNTTFALLFKKESLAFHTFRSGVSTGGRKILNSTSKSNIQCSWTLKSDNS